HRARGRLDTGPGVGLVRAAPGGARVAHAGAAHPRGRLPGADRSGAGTVTASGSLTPRPGAAPVHRQVAAQASMEARLMLRNGEQLLLALVIPVIVLVGAVLGADRVGMDLERSAVDTFAPGVLALAVMSTAFTSLAIATGFE